MNNNMIGWWYYKLHHEATIGAVKYSDMIHKLEDLLYIDMYYSDVNLFDKDTSDT